MKLAEKCASTRENIKLGEEFEELDIQATRLWNLSTTLTRVKEDGDSSLSSKGKDVLHGTLLFSSSGPTETDLASPALGFFHAGLFTPILHSEASKYYPTI
jgi:hypothetical protein